MAGGVLLWLQFVRAIRLLRSECVRGFGRLRLSAFSAHVGRSRLAALGARFWQKRTDVCALRGAKG